MAIETQEQLKFEKELVDYKTHSEMQRLNVSAAFTYVTEGTKAAFLLNGAAGIAVMTFLGAQRSVTWPAVVLVWPLVLFAVGAALAVATFGLAYLAQAYYAEMNLRQRPGSLLADRFRNIAVLTFGGSVLAFVAGLIWAAVRL